VLASQQFAGGGLRLCWTGVRGHSGLGAALAIAGEITATGYPLGAAVLLTTEVTAVNLRNGAPAHLGSISPLPVTLAYIRQPFAGSGAPREGEFVLSVTAVLPIESSMLETLEDLRQGGDFSLQLESVLLMVDRGMVPGAAGDRAPQAPEDVSPVLPHVDNLAISQAAWGQVLQDWGRGLGIPLIVPLVEVVSDPQRGEIVGHLREAWRKVDGADYSGSLAASRKALELLRKVNPVEGRLPVVRDRTIDQRIHAVLNSLFDLASASAHTEPPVKDFVPLRADAVALVAATAALTQEIFARQRLS
jgi:hypothetical protein